MLLCVCLCVKLLLMQIQEKWRQYKRNLINKKYNDFDKIFSWKKLHNIIGLKHNTCSF